MRSLVSGQIRGRPVRRGDTYWCTIAEAHADIAERRAEALIGPDNRPVVGPSVTPFVGPTETPEVAPKEKPEAEVPEKKPCLLRAKGWPVDRMSRVEKTWAGRTAVCLASGPSLTKEQVEAVRGLPTVAVNDCYLIAPWADVAYFADSKWWAWHKERPEFKGFAGQRCTIWTHGNAVSDPQIYMLRNGGAEGLSADPAAINTGSHSGYQAVNIVSLAGARRILLLGYDCRQVNGRKHFFGDHPDKTEPPYSAIRARYHAIVPDAKRLGIEIINCTPGSAIDAFPRGDLATVLATERTVP